MNFSLSEKDIELLVDNTKHLSTRERYPEQVLALITCHPKVVLKIIRHFVSFQNDDQRKESCLRLITECLAQVHYELDRKNPDIEILLKDIEQAISAAYQQGTFIDRMALNEVLYNSELPLSIEVAEDDDKSIGTSKQLDIVPTPANFLEQVKREHSIRSVFELYEFLMISLFSMPPNEQLVFIGELALSNKAMPHELAVLMLLHQSEKIRKHIPALLESFVSRKVFNSLDLRRLIVIRSWLPTDERSPVDELIKSIKKSGVSPMPYPQSQIIDIIATPFDGAGAQGIVFSAKHKGRRMVGGFIVKVGVGIKDAWVNPKAARDEFDYMCTEIGSQKRRVSPAYVTKAVNHFLQENELSGRIPSTYFLQIAEIFGASTWYPEHISIEDEAKKIHEKTGFDYSDKAEVDASFARMKRWDERFDFTQAWFECGDVAEQAFDLEFKDANPNKSPKNMIMDAAHNAFILPELNKWKVIFMFMCLRERSKSVGSSLWKDFLILAVQTSKQKRLKSNPVLKDIAEKSIASFMHKHSLRFGAVNEEAVPY